MTYYGDDDVRAEDDKTSYLCYIVYVYCNNWAI
jgi:hypothetical protein